MSIRGWLNPWMRNPGTWRTNCITPFYIRYWASADFGICGGAPGTNPLWILRMTLYTYKSMYICYFTSMESYYKYWLFSLNNVSLTSFHINKYKSIISFLKAEQFSIAHVRHNSFNQFQSMYIEAVYQDSFGHKWQNQIQISLYKMENLLDNITENLMARSRMTILSWTITKDWPLSISHFYSSLLLSAFWIYYLFSHVANEAVPIYWILGRWWLAYLGSYTGL